MGKKKVGIILGEEYTQIISSKEGKIYDDLTLVCWNNLTREIVLKGKDVKNTIGRIDDPLVVVKLLKNYTIDNLEIFKTYIETLIDDFKGVFENADVIVSCPNIENHFVCEFLELSLKAKSNVLSIKFVKKIILSALGSGANIYDEYGVLVLDIDHSFAKVALIIEGKIEKEKEIKYAEEYLDDSLIKYIKEEHQLVITEESVEKIKWSIGTIIKLRDDLELSIVGKDIITNERRVVVCGSEEFKKIFIKLFTNYKTLITSVLESSSPLMRSSVIKNGLFVSGELCDIVGVKDFFEDFFNFPVTISKKKGYSSIEGTLKFTK